MPFARAVNLYRDIFVSFEEATLYCTIKQNIIKHAENTDLMRIHRKILEEGDETLLAVDVTDNFTEFSNGSHVLLQPVTGSKNR